MATGELLKLGGLASGRGTNLQAILNAIASGELVAEVKLVVCNHRGAQAIERARAAGVPVEICERASFESRSAQHQAIMTRLEEAGVDLVVCAGWDRVLDDEVIRRFAGRIINVHPALLPSFGGGLHAIKDALEYGVKITGCTVHFVTEALDQGPVISQAAVQVLPDDTEETLGERIHREEHRLLVEAIRDYSQGRLQVTGRTVTLKNG